MWHATYSFLICLFDIFAFLTILAIANGNTMNRYIEIESYDALLPLIAPGALLKGYAFQNIEFGRNAVQCRFEDCIFFGCSMPDVMRAELAPDCCVLPQLPVPFNPFPAQLYTAATLYAGYDYRNCLLYTSPSPRDPKTSRMPSSA